MALDPLEWGVIAVMGVAIFIWGPEKVPEIAKTLGSARRDLDAATKQLQGIGNELGKSVNGGSLDNLLGTLIPTLPGEPIPGNPSQDEIARAMNNTGGTAVASGQPGGSAIPAPKIGAPAMVTPAAAAAKNAVSGDRLLVDMARKLGISTQGKTRDDIQNEIIARASQPSARQAAPVQEKVQEPVQDTAPVVQEPTPPQDQPVAG